MKFVKYITLGSCLLTFSLSFNAFSQSSLRSGKKTTSDKFGSSSSASTVTEVKSKEDEEDENYYPSSDELVLPSSDASNIAQTPTPPVNPEDELIYFNAVDTDIKDLIKQISRSTGTNFLIEDRLKGKITIISEKPMSRDMVYQAFLSALEVMGYTTVQTPGGLIKIVDTKGAVAEPLDIFTDNTPITDKFITRIVQVQNISANDISSVVKSLVSKEGNLFAYPQTNSLILTDSGSNIDRILRIVKELDREGPQEVIEIIPIIHADAKDINDKIMALFENDLNDQSSQKSTRRSRRSKKTPELDDAPSLSKVIADERTNSIIVLGSKRSIVKLRALVARLDSPSDGVEGKIHVYYLKHANAKEMSDVLSNLVSGASPKNSKSKSKKSDGGAVQLEGGVKVTADESTNSLVITASPKDYNTLITQVIDKLDIPRRQVYLEAMVMELSVRKSKTLGLAGNFGKIFSLGGESINAFAGLLPLFPNAVSGISAAAGGLAGGGFSDRTIDVNGTSIPAVSAIMQALQEDSDVNILSTPSILTLDNQEAKIQVGNEVPVRTGRTVSNTGENFSISREDTGVILTVTPQTSDSDTVRLKIAQEISSVQPDATEDGPTFSKRTVDTVVVAHDKQTIVIGGLLSDEQNVSTSRVPILGDIPLVGNIFKNKRRTVTKQNVIVFITPYIIRERADYLDILEKKIAERNLFLELNFGVSQRKHIRESLQAHVGSLLQYSESNSRYNHPDYKPSRDPYYVPDSVIKGKNKRNLNKYPQNNYQASDYRSEPQIQNTNSKSQSHQAAPVLVPSSKSQDDYSHPSRRVRSFD